MSTFSSGPPKYEEVVNLYDITNGVEVEDPIVYNYTNGPSASSPLLNGTNNVNSEISQFLGQALRGIEDSIFMEKQPGQKDYGEYKYNIRNSGNQALILQGTVSYNHFANIENLMNRLLLEIHPAGYVDAFEIHKFRFKFGNVTLGNCELRLIDGRLSQCGLCNVVENGRYSINIIGEQAADIIIGRQGSMSPIAKINVPARVGADNFNCKIVFENSEGITAIEKFLVMGVAVSFLNVRNGKLLTPREASEEKATGYCMGCLVFALIIVAFVVFILWLNHKECEWKPSRCRKSA